MRKKMTVLTVALAVVLAASPAQAAFDEGGGAAQAPTVAAAPEGFDWADAGIGAGIGAVLVATLGTGAIVRRHGQAQRLAEPVARWQIEGRPRPCRSRSEPGAEMRPVRLLCCEGV